MYRRYTEILMLGCIGFLFVMSCDRRKPRIQYMPDMYLSISGETYAESKVFLDKKVAQLPVQGTISRGHIPYQYPDTNEGYEKAKKELKSPLKYENLENKKVIELYEIYCGVCHGKKGDGQGELTKREKFLGIPNYKDRDITEGSIYHVIMYGKNMMGSHASQLKEKERWLIVKYVEKLRNELLK